MTICLNEYHFVVPINMNSTLKEGIYKVVAIHHDEFKVEDDHHFYLTEWYEIKPVDETEMVKALNLMKKRLNEANQQNAELVASNKRQIMALRRELYITHKTIYTMGRRMAEIRRFAYWQDGE